MSLLLATSGDIASGVVEAEGVDFDGVNDYLSRSTDLVGNVDSKTFTFSCWVYTQEDYMYVIETTNIRFQVFFSAANKTVRLYGRSSTGTNVLMFETPAGAMSKQTWNHFLCSFDMSSTSLRKVYCNDVLINITYSDYVNAAIDFTNNNFAVGSDYTGATKYKGRLSNLYLDYTYRDLSIEANRRLFITADGKPTPTGNIGGKNIIGGGSVDSSDILRSGIILNSNTQYSTGDGYASSLLDSTYITVSMFLQCKTLTTGDIINICGNVGEQDSVAFSITGESPPRLRISAYVGSSIVFQGYYAHLDQTWQHIYFRTNDNGVYSFMVNGVETPLESPQSYASGNKFKFGRRFGIGGATNIGLAHVYWSNSYMANPYSPSRGFTPATTGTWATQLPFSVDGNNLVNYGTLPNLPNTGSGSIIKSYTNCSSLPLYAPILYLPMKDAATAHINEGTGGNFVQNGTLDTASRGANQDNCKASVMTSKYLSKNSQLTGISTSTKQITLSFNITSKNTDTTIYHVFDSYGSYIEVSVSTSTSGNPITIKAKNSAGANILTFYIGYGVIWTGVNYSIQVSFDLNNTSKRHAFINGKSAGSWTTYTNDYIYLAPLNTPNYTVFGCHTGAANLVGNGGEFYFDTKYTDLATSNPFWDSVENKPIPVRQVIYETGVTPLLAMPLDASNAGKNYGTGGDFTANSAPYVGARGGSEFWARSAYCNYSTNYLSLIATGVSLVSTTCAFCIKRNASSLGTNVDVLHANNNTYGLTVSFDTSNTLLFKIAGIAGINTLYVSSYVGKGVADVWLTVLFSYNNTTKTMECNVNGTQTSAVRSYSITGATNISIQSMWSSSAGYTGTFAAFYFTTDCIDFSQETNRLKFVDGLGYPLDLAKQIDAGVIPKPLVYLPFNDPSNLGKNLGTGGDFTVNGTVKSGSDVLG